MYSIKFYRDKNGCEPLKEFLVALSKKKDKNSRINLNKIRDYIKALSLYGKDLGEPFIKHLDAQIWELRPLRHRILFFGCDGDTFVLLSHFVKKTQKTPRKEIEKAKRLMQDFLKRMRDKNR